MGGTRQSRLASSSPLGIIVMGVGYWRIMPSLYPYFFTGMASSSASLSASALLASLLKRKAWHLGRRPMTSKGLSRPRRFGEMILRSQPLWPALRPRRSTSSAALAVYNRPAASFPLSSSICRRRSQHFYKADDLQRHCLDIIVYNGFIYSCRSCFIGIIQINEQSISAFWPLCTIDCRAGYFVTRISLFLCVESTAASASISFDAGRRRSIIFLLLWHLKPLDNARTVLLK